MCENCCQRTDRQKVIDFLEALKIPYDECENGYSFRHPESGCVWVIEFDKNDVVNYEVIE